MAYCVLNGAAVLEATITLPRVGAWTADLAVEGTTSPSGKVALSFGLDNSISLVGTVVRAGLSRGAAVARLVGGAGGLDAALPAKAYGGCSLQLPLSELLAAAGEALSPKTDSAVLSVGLGSWARLQMSAGSALRALLELAPAGSVWRVLQDGTIWVGADTWQPSALVSGYVLTKDDPNHNRQEIAADLPTVFPGQTFAGKRVSGVEHRIAPDRLRTTVYYEG